MRILLLPLTCCLAAGSARAQQAPPAPWMELGRGVEIISSLDTSRVSLRDGHAEVWVRFDQTPEEVPGAPGKTFARMDVLLRIDCAGRRVTDVRMQLRDPKGTLMSDEPAQSRWNAFAGHPFGGNVLPAVCEWLADRQTP